MNNLLKFIKISIDLKFDMWRCRRFDKATDEYRLAEHYQHALDHLENNEQDVNALILETEKHQVEFRDRTELSRMLTSLHLFLNHLKDVRND